MKSESAERDTADTLATPLVLHLPSPSTGTLSPTSQTGTVAGSQGSQPTHPRTKLSIDKQRATVRVLPDVIRHREMVNPKVRIAFSDACETHTWPLFIHGGIGCGKTCAVLCMLDHVTNTGWARFYSLTEWTEKANQAEQGRMQQAGGIITVGHWWKQNEDAYLIAVDELGVVDASGSRDQATREYTTLKRLMDIRTGKPAVYVSNYSPDQLERFYDARIVSRLRAGIVVHDDGHDRRLGK